MEPKKRKKWTPVEQPDDSVLRLREKRKWQIALRRYVIEKNKCIQYAPYFGLDIEKFRQWISAQFVDGLSWENFSEKWQLDHVIPVAYFDFGIEKDLILCWNFLNIRVNNIGEESFRSDLLSARGYFESLLTKTGISLCKDFIRKIDAISASHSDQTVKQTAFLLENQALIRSMEGFSVHDFQQLNEGLPIEELLAEKTLLKNFG